MQGQNQEQDQVRPNDQSYKWLLYSTSATVKVYCVRSRGRCRSYYSIAIHLTFIRLLLHFIDMDLIPSGILSVLSYQQAHQI